jgi:hypothetical protein
MLSVSKRRQRPCWLSIPPTGGKRGGVEWSD